MVQKTSGGSGLYTPKILCIQKCVLWIHVCLYQKNKVGIQSMYLCCKGRTDPLRVSKVKVLNGIKKVTSSWKSIQLFKSFFVLGYLEGSRATREILKMCLSNIKCFNVPTEFRRQ